MRKILLLPLLSFIMTAMTFAQTDSILLATYEPGGPIQRTFSWTASDISTVANPVQVAVNNSATVLKFVTSTLWSSAVGYNNIGVANSPVVSLYQYPIVKFSLMSETLLSKVVQIQATDIDGYSAIVNATETSPGTVNQWKTMTVDFTNALCTTPLGLVKEIVIFIDRPSSSNSANFYIDNVRLLGPHAAITPSTVLTLYSEVFSNNPWWMSDDPEGGKMADGTFLGLVNGPWGNNLTGGAQHYNMSDSIKVCLWGSNNDVAAQLYSASARASHSVININNLNVAGKGNLKFYYDLWWKNAPAAFTEAPTVEYQIDGGGWTNVSTSSALPAAINTWAKNVEFPLTGITGNNMNIRITNSTTGRGNIANLALKGTAFFADSTKVTAAGNQKILATGSTLQMSSTVYPTSVGQGVYWYIFSGNGSINSSGLYTGGTGDVKIRAMSTTFPNCYGEITLHNYNLVDTIKVTPKNDSIKSLGGSLQMHATIIPSNADSLNVNWSVTNLNGEATISSTGLLTAKKTGQVIVKATAKDTSNVFGVDTVTLIKQIWVNDITVSTKDDATTITENGGTLQLFAAVLPDTAINKSVTWSVVPGTGKGNIVTRNDSVFVQASKNGTVYVKAKANDGSNVADSLLLTFTNQLAVTNVVITSTTDSIKTDNGTLQLKARAFPIYAADTVVLWKIISPSAVPDTATINTTTGLVTAVRNGSVAVMAYSRADTTISDTVIVKIINQIVPVVSVAIDSTVKTITVKGGSLSLSSIIGPADATNKTVTWSVDNTSLATIDANTGLLTAVGGINGSVKVTATANDGTNVIGTLTIILSNQIIYVSGITVSGGTKINTKGGTLNLSAAVLPENADNKGITWSVDNTSLATIDANTGLLTSKGVNGSVVVTATAKDGSNKTASVTVTIDVKYIVSIVISGNNKINSKGGSLQYTAIITPDNATNKKITWSVDNPLLATIDSTGKLTALANGVVKVIASANDSSNVKGYFSVTLSNQSTRVTSITISGGNKIDVKGGTLLLTAVVTPNNATIKTVSWSVDNFTIANIDNTGLLTAKSDGVVNVTATSDDLSKTNASITVTISNQSTGINNSEIERVNIYPTLVADVLTISGSTNFKLIEIFNTHGKLMKHLQNVASESTINVSTLSSGMYMMRITEDNNISYTKRFVKK